MEGVIHSHPPALSAAEDGLWITRRKRLYAPKRLFLFEIRIRTFCVRWTITSPNSVR